MAKKELTVDEHNANVFAEIKELEAKNVKKLPNKKAA